MTETHNAEITSITKTDRIGRARYSEEYKREVLDGFEASAMGGPAFARHCGLKYPTFAGWVAKRKREGAQGLSDVGSEPEKFVIAEFAESGTDRAPGGHLRVSLPGGASAEVVDTAGAGLLAHLLKSLA